MTLQQAAETVVNSCLAPAAGEKAVLIYNPEQELPAMAHAMAKAIAAKAAVPELVEQERRSSTMPMSDQALEALSRKPEMIISLSADKLGYDPELRTNPKLVDGKSFPHHLYWLIRGLKTSRGFWSPGITAEHFLLGAGVDWQHLKRQSKRVANLLTHFDRVHVTSPLGTDLRFDISGMEGWKDDGDFTQPGLGGNFPAGESFVSPLVGTAQGILIVDGTMALGQGSEVCDQPIRLTWKDGLLKDMEGGATAAKLADFIRAEESKAAPEFKAFCRNLGEFGVGLLPLNALTGSMLVDEKKLGTCHLAIGSDYDGQAPGPIHLDGIVLQPTVDLESENESLRLLENGEALW